MSLLIVLVMRREHFSCLFCQILIFVEFSNFFIGGDAKYREDGCMNTLKKVSSLTVLLVT